MDKNKFDATDFEFCLFCIHYFKDIVQPKRGGSIGEPIDSPRLRTQSQIFLCKLKELLSCFKFQKTVTAFRD
jgi:hypothetical protein